MKENHLRKVRKSKERKVKNIGKEISDSSSKPSFLYGSNCDVIYAYPIDASRASLPQEEPPKSKRGLEVYNTLYGEMARVSSFTLYRLLN